MRRRALFLLMSGLALGSCDGPEELVDSGATDAASADAGPFDAGPPDAGYPDVDLFTPVDLDDDALADQALALLGYGLGTVPRCNSCHGLSRSRIHGWGARMNDTLSCVGTKRPTTWGQAQQILSCMRSDPPIGEYGPENIGFLTTATELAWFEQTFEVAYRGSRSQLTDYRLENTMPPLGVLALDQPQVDILFTWVTRGMPGLDTRVPDSVAGGDCTPMVGPEVAAHVAAMATLGWRVRNADAALPMYGCAGAETGRACLSALPRAEDRPFSSAWATVPGGSLRVLYEYDYPSSFWTRSSAGGRFVSHGGGPGGASVIDLVTGRIIPVAAAYDPAFFPDNSGFVIQGVMPGGGGGFCDLALLASDPPEIDFTEPECTVFSAVGLYQHLAAVAGGDYWTVFGQFMSDDGGQSGRTGPLAALFDASAHTNLVPLIHEGGTYAPRMEIQVSTPFEGDVAISPSGRLLLSRLSSDVLRQAGFVMRQLNATPAGDTYDVEVPVVAEYCTRGSKVSFSFDERWGVLHRYITDDDAVDLGFTGPTDPGFAEYQTRGGANLFLIDLLNGLSQRITTLAPGQYALFPHFRSDGWIYFVVRDTAVVGEYLLASDAALLFEEPP